MGWAYQITTISEDPAEVKKVLEKFLEEKQDGEVTERDFEEYGIRNIVLVAEDEDTADIGSSGLFDDQNPEEQILTGNSGQSQRILQVGPDQGGERYVVSDILDKDGNNIEHKEGKMSTQMVMLVVFAMNPLQSMSKQVKMRMRPKKEEEKYRVDRRASDIYGIWQTRF
jgi:hypothetical protein